MTDRSGICLKKRRNRTKSGIHEGWNNSNPEFLVATWHLPIQFEGAICHFKKSAHLVKTSLKSRKQEARRRDCTFSRLITTSFLHVGRGVIPGRCQLYPAGQQVMKSTLIRLHELGWRGDFFTKQQLLMLLLFSTL